MTQELVMACFIQALDIAPKHRRKQHTVAREKDLVLASGQAFLRVGASNGKLVENWWKTSGQSFGNKRCESDMNYFVYFEMYMWMGWLANPDKLDSLPWQAWQLREPFQIAKLLAILKRMPPTCMNEDILRKTSIEGEFTYGSGNIYNQV